MREAAAYAAKQAPSASGRGGVSELTPGRVAMRPSPATGAGRRRRARAPTWPLWEVFVRARRGLSHQHVGALHAPDAAMALRNARDVYTRRQEGVSLIWVVPPAAITASSPDEKDAFFDPAADKAYRHPTVLRHPAEVQHL